jgi:hypothetical protein
VIGNLPHNCCSNAIYRMDGRVGSSPLHATRCVVRLDIGWKSKGFRRLPAWLTVSAPRSNLSRLYAPFLGGGSSVESWLYRLGICKRQLNEPRAAAAEAVELRTGRRNCSLRSAMPSGSSQQVAGGLSHVPQSGSIQLVIVFRKPNDGREQFSSVVRSRGVGTSRRRNLHLI